MGDIRGEFGEDVHLRIGVGHRIYSCEREVEILVEIWGISMERGRY